MIPYPAIQALVSQGYLLLSRTGQYVSAIKEVDGQDRYVLMKYENGHFFIVST